jgi:hypothetical protein
MRACKTKYSSCATTSKNPAFIDAQGLRQRHLLQHGDPSKITFSFTLFERTHAGNVLRVQADTLDQPFDLNNGMKLELGSTAKLRTLAHYLELVASLYHEFSRLEKSALSHLRESALDPITRWVVEIMNADPSIELKTLLDKSMDRQYSADPGEVFFTGGGRYVFANFDSRIRSPPAARQYLSAMRRAHRPVPPSGPKLEMTTSRRSRVLT